MPNFTLHNSYSKPTQHPTPNTHHPQHPTPNTQHPTPNTVPHLFPALIAKGLSRPPGLAAADITVQPGDIHAIVGHSGAGKTTLAEILAGIIQPATGTMHLQGQLTAYQSRANAEAKGVRLIPQTWDIQSQATVVDTLLMDAIPRRFGFIDTHALNDHARAMLQMVGLQDIDPKTRICELPAGKQKLVQVAGVLAKPVSLLILDDPCAALCPAEQEVLFGRLSQFQYTETGIVYCTPSAEEALQVGDEITVLREGRPIATHFPDQVFIAQVAGEMIGRDTSNDPKKRLRAYCPEVAFRVEGLCVDHCVYGLSLKVKRGEIVGLFGKYGAGQSEAVRAMAGEQHRTDGEIFLRASALPSKIKSPAEAIANGVGLVPDPWGRHPDPNVSTPPVLRAMNAQNPQKASIAKLLQSNPAVLLFDNPTRGLNIACRQEVYRAIQDIADQGIAIIAASTDPTELAQFSDRIATMVDGRIRKG